MGDPREFTPVQIEEIEKETRGFGCPNCGHHMQFRLSVKVNAVGRTLRAEEAAKRDGREMTPKGTKDVKSEINNPPMGAERPALMRLAQYYRDTGILGAFEEVAKELKAHQLPKNMDKYFISWISCTVKANLIPKLVLRRLINEFDDGQIDVYHAQQIGAVVSDGILRCFVPMHLLRGEVIRAGGGSKTKLRTLATEEGLERWIRTKHGYVYGGGALFSEMQKQAKGSFDNVRTA